MANCNPPVKNQAFDLGFTLYKSDGSVIANPGTLTAKISKDFGDYADIGTTSEEDTTYGQMKAALSATEMNADVVSIYIKDDTAGCVPFTATIYTVAGDAFARLGAPAGASVSADVAAVKAETATIVADTNELQTNQGNWATATGFSTHSAADVKTAIEAAGSHLTLIKTKTDSLAFNGTDVKATLDGEKVTVTSNEDKTGYALTSAYDAATGAASSGDIATALNTYDAPTKTEMDAAFTEIKGATWASGTDSLEAIRDRGDAAWATATGFTTAAVWTDEKAGFIDVAISSIEAGSGSSGATAQEIWEYASRTLTSGGIQSGDITDVVSGVLASYGTAKTGDAMTLTAAYDAAKTAASQASVDALPTTGDIKTSLEAEGSSVAQILADTNELQQNQSGWLTATGFATPANVSGISAIDTKITTVSGYVDEIESRLTATRAGYLDNLVNLDTTVGSRAPSATALSTAVWTNTKAGYIDTTIGSRLASASYTTPPTTGDIKTSMEAEGGLLNSINSKTTNLPSDPADQSTLETLITDNALTAADVWAYATRTITSGGVTPQQIWEYATRTITSGGVTAQQIWEYTTRTITSGGITAQDVWEYVTRTITAGGLTSGEVQAAVTLALVAYEAAKTGDQMDLINVPNASAVSVIQSGLATATNLNLVKQVTDKVDTALELDGDVYRFTTNSLEMIPAASAEITAENIENIRIEIDTNSTKLAEILEDTSTSIPSAISSIPTGETITAEEIVTELLTTDYTASTGTNTIGRWFNAIRTLLGHKSVENSEGTSVSFKEDDDTTEAGTQTWDNTTKTRGKYTGW